VIAAQVLGLENQRPALGRDLGAQTRPGDSSANDHNVESSHFNRGYELESRAV
jgi:hypothetical protein